MFRQHSQAGAVNPLVISNVIVGLLAVGLAAAAVWSFANYTDQKENVDSKVAVAVEAAKKQQMAADEESFLKREKSPTREFVGPDDYGRVTFQHPKTWSVYIAKEGSNGEYEVYLNPHVVPTVAANKPYALRVGVESRTYDEVMKTFEKKVSNGELKATPITISGNNGIRLDGSFTKDRAGSAVYFKLRDKTLSLATDSELFKGDFNDIVLPSLTFNP